MNDYLFLFDQDPTEYYGRIRIDPYSRRQSVSIAELFPSKPDKTCSCGCGVILTGRKTRWASKECQILPLRILGIINGDVPVIYSLLKWKFGERCNHCYRSTYDLWESVQGLPYKEQLKLATLELDHIKPVYKGGGGCWLDNYQLLCYRCHKDKTKQDRSVS